MKLLYQIPFENLYTSENVHAYVQRTACKFVICDTEILMFSILFILQ